MFRREWTIRWGDGDLYGIAYYPRIVEALHDTADMYMEQLGHPFWELSEQYDIGLPIVEVNVEFHEPLSCGDTVDIKVESERGKTSLRFDYTGILSDGTISFTGYEQRVCVPVDGDKGIPLPKELRVALKDSN